MTTQMMTVAMKQFGPVDTFVDEFAAIPRPKAGEIQIQVYAAGFNPVDTKIRRGWYGGNPDQVLGFECSGVVTAAHEDSPFKLGSRVSALTIVSSNGSYAEYVCVPSEMAVPIPDDLPMSDAAVFPLAALTAYRATIGCRAFQAGNTVFVAGIGGGVGSFAIQFLREIGVKDIYTIAKDNESAQFLQERLNIPADHIVLYEGKTQDDLKAEIIGLRQGALFDGTLDLVGGETKQLCIELTQCSGHFSTILPEQNGASIPTWGESDIIRSRSMTVHQTNVGSDLANKDRWSLYTKQMHMISEGLANGKYQCPVVTNVGSLSSKTVAAAHNLLEGGRVKGKLVMVVL